MPHARPTTDRAKEALFNILDQYYYFDQIAVLDLYSGMGSMALEFGSRGVENLVAVDWNKRSVHYIKSLASKLEIPLDIIASKAIPYLRSCKTQFDIVFADPPYDNTREIDLLIETVGQVDIVKKGGVFVLEHISSYKVNHPACYDSRKYGQSSFSFFKFETDS